MKANLKIIFSSILAVCLQSAYANHCEIAYGHDYQCDETDKWLCIEYRFTDGFPTDYKNNVVPFMLSTRTNTDNNTFFEGTNFNPLKGASIMCTLRRNFENYEWPVNSFEAVAFSVSDDPITSCGVKLASDEIKTLPSFGYQVIYNPDTKEVACIRH